MFRNLQAKFINTRMTSFWMYVSAAVILVGPKTRRPNQTETFVEIYIYVYHIVAFEFNSITEVHVDICQ